MRRCASATGTDGQALIEFALVAPLLLVILFAIFDVASALNYWNDETNLSNVVARYATVAASASNLPSCTLPSGTVLSGSTAGYDVYEYVHCEAYSDSANLANAVGVCVNDETNPSGASEFSAGDAVKITVEYPYNFLHFLSAALGKTHVTLTSSATMMVESSTQDTTVDGWLSDTNSDTSNPAYASASDYNNELTSCNDVT